MRRVFKKGTVFAAILTVCAGWAGNHVALAQEQPQFFINPGLNDAWWNSSVKGQGFLFTVLPETKVVFLAWFTFDTERPPEDVSAILGDPGHRWFTALGVFEPGNSVSMQIELTEGLIFDSEDPPLTPDKQSYVGTMTLTFTDCSNGTLTYDFPDQGESGEIALTRTAPDPANIELCELLDAELQAAR